MTVKKIAESTTARADQLRLVEEEDGARLKISITMPPDILEKLDAYRKRRGGLNRSALIALAVDWFMDEFPVKHY